MLSWLGTWFGKWFGGGAVSPPGSMSGQASLSLASTGTLTLGGAIPVWASGSTSLGMSASATLTGAPATTGNFWSDGFWAAGFWSDGFWGVFEQPFPTLSPGKQLYVFTELSRVFTRTDVEQIIAVAEANNLSVLRAASALSMVVSVEETKIVATHRPKREVREDYRPAINRLSAGVKKSVSIFTREASLSVLTKPDELFIRQGATESVVVRDLGQERFTVRQSDVVGIDETELSIHSTQPGTIVIG